MQGHWQLCLGPWQSHLAGPPCPNKYSVMRIHFWAPSLSPLSPCPVCPHQLPCTRVCVWKCCSCHLKTVSSSPFSLLAAQVKRILITGYVLLIYCMPQSQSSQCVSKRVDSLLELPPASNFQICGRCEWQLCNFNCMDNHLKLKWRAITLHGKVVCTGPGIAMGKVSPLKRENMGYFYSTVCSKMTTKFKFMQHLESKYWPM